MNTHFSIRDEVRSTAKEKEIISGRLFRLEVDGELLK